MLASSPEVVSDSSRGSSTEYLTPDDMYEPLLIPADQTKKKSILDRIVDAIMCLHLTVCVSLGIAFVFFLLMTFYEWLRKAKAVA